MKVAHFSDLHYCPAYFEEAHRCFSNAVRVAIYEGAELAVISGDLFDHRVAVSHESVSGLLRNVAWLAEHMPVFILQGTFSHDVPGALGIFDTIGGKHSVLYADTHEQFVLVADSDEWFCVRPGSTIPPGTTALVSAMPPFNKAEFVDSKLAGDHAFEILRSFRPLNDAVRAAGIPTIGVGHGTVQASVTEHGVPMAGPDHEFTTGVLFAAGCDAFMLGHIHKHQCWRAVPDSQVIAYPGSIGRFHFGEMGDKGWLMWDITPGGPVDIKLHPTPATELLNIDFTGEPDMEAIQALGVSEKGKSLGAPVRVRIRYTVDEERAATLDKEQMRDAFSWAQEVKIEAIVHPITRGRLTGITFDVSTANKLRTYCDATGIDPLPLLERLEILEGGA